MSFLCCKQVEEFVDFLVSVDYENRTACSSNFSVLLELVGSSVSKGSLKLNEDYAVVNDYDTVGYTVPTRPLHRSPTL